MMITMNLIFRKYAQIVAAAVARIGVAAAAISVQYAQFLFCFWWLVRNQVANVEIEIVA